MMTLFSRFSDLSHKFIKKTRDKPCLLIEKPDLVVFFHFPVENDQRSIVARAIQLGSPLNLAESSSWLLLKENLSANTMSGGSIILHPSLYLSQITTGNQLPQLSEQFFYQRSAIASNRLEYWHDYYRDKFLSDIFSLCHYIIPCSELVKNYAFVSNIESPWIIANSEYLWVVDVHGRFHELCLGNTQQVDWLLHTLLSGNCIEPDCTCLVDKQNTVSMLSGKGLTNISTDSRLSSMLTLLATLATVNFDICHDDEKS